MKLHMTAGSVFVMSDSEQADLYFANLYPLPVL